MGRCVLRGEKLFKNYFYLIFIQNGGEDFEAAMRSGYRYGIN